MNLFDHAERIEKAALGVWHKRIDSHFRALTDPAS
jgi:hypothetical protein